MYHGSQHCLVNATELIRSDSKKQNSKLKSLYLILANTPTLIPTLNLIDLGAN
jgi:hypothetical protein